MGKRETPAPGVLTGSDAGTRLLARCGSSQSAEPGVREAALILDGARGRWGERPAGLSPGGTPRGQGADDREPVVGGWSGKGEFGATGGGGCGGGCVPGAGFEPGEGERAGGRGEAALASAREGGSTPRIFYAGGDPPRGELVGEAGKAVAIARGVGGVAVPIGAEQDAFAGDDVVCDRAEGRDGEQGAGCDGGRFTTEAGPKQSESGWGLMVSGPVAEWNGVSRCVPAWAERCQVAAFQPGGTNVNVGATDTPLWTGGEAG